MLLILIVLQMTLAAETAGYRSISVTCVDSTEKFRENYQALCTWMEKRIKSIGTDCNHGLY